MKNRPWLVFVPIGVIVLALAVFSFFIKWWAPLLILAALVVQAAVVFAIVRSKTDGAYSDRAYERRQQYEKDGDAEAWLDGEAREVRAVGYRYWSSGAKAQSALNRAAALVALGRTGEAAALLGQLEPKRLDRDARARLEGLVVNIQSQSPP